MANPKGIRSEGKDIFSADFTVFLPNALNYDEKTKSIAKAITEELLLVSGKIETVLIYSRINELPEDLIDILAYDLFIDWYDASLPLETKREVLKSAIKVKRKRGTKYAVENALQSQFGKHLTVIPWFDYGGQEYTFKIILDLNSGNDTVSGNENSLLENIKRNKSVRDSLYCITYTFRFKDSVVNAGCFLHTKLRIIIGQR